jgi:lipoprotein-releasing system permease protein
MNKIVGFFIKKFVVSPRKEWLQANSLFMVLGIIISVATLTIALAIFQGYETVLKETILNVNSHIYVFSNHSDYLSPKEAEELQIFLHKQPEVNTVGKLVLAEATASHQHRLKGCLIRGIDWQQQMPTNYKEAVKLGDYELNSSKEVVLGAKLAQKLNLNIGDSVKLISPSNLEFSPMGLQTRSKNYIIVGLYDSGMHEYDSRYVFMNLEAAQQFKAIGNTYSMLEVKLQSEFIDKADYLAYVWQNQLGYDYQLSSWIDFNGNLFSLLKLEKWVLFIILSFLVLIASFNVVSFVSTSIMEKRREQAILKAYGAKNSIIRKIYLGKTMLIAFVTVNLGQVIGFLLAWFIGKQQFFMLKGDVYFLEKINISVNFYNWIITLAVSMIIILAAAWFPIKKLTRMQITTAIK